MHVHYVYGRLQQHRQANTMEARSAFGRDLTQLGAIDLDQCQKVEVSPSKQVRTFKAAAAGVLFIIAQHKSKDKTDRQPHNTHTAKHKHMNTSKSSTPSIEEHIEQHRHREDNEKNNKDTHHSCKQRQHVYLQLTSPGSAGIAAPKRPAPQGRPNQ